MFKGIVGLQKSISQLNTISCDITEYQFRFEVCTWLHQMMESGISKTNDSDNREVLF